MRPRRLAVIGCGRLGRACAEAILSTQDLRLAGFVRRAESLGAPLTGVFRDVPATADIEALGAIDAALLCLPPQIVTTTAHDLLQHPMPIIECAALDAEVFRGRKEQMHRLARRQHVAAVLGAGWNPGALALLRGLFTLLIPRGHTKITDRGREPAPHAHGARRGRRA